MKPIFFRVAVAIAVVFTIGGLAYAGGPGGMVGGGMGGGGRGMMGGGHMMDYGRDYAAPYPDQYNRYNRPEESYSYGPGETKRLRQEIRAKRQELSELYRTENPDKALIDKKINDLSKLEDELDHRLAGTEYQRR